jgi:hypothetical protein
MPYVQQGLIVGLVLLVTGMAWAGGSNYGITPGSRPQVAGKISEWQVPTPVPLENFDEVPTILAGLVAARHDRPGGWLDR